MGCNAPIIALVGICFLETISPHNYRLYRNDENSEIGALYEPLNRCLNFLFIQKVLIPVSLHQALINKFLHFTRNLYKGGANGGSPLH